MITKQEMPACPVAATVALIGSKWKILIMRNLLVRPWRFNELRRDLEGVSQKVLTDSLRSMEEDGIVVRTVYPKSRQEWSTPFRSWGSPCAPSWTLWKLGEQSIKRTEADDFVSLPK